MAQDGSDTAGAGRAGGELGPDPASLGYEQARDELVRVVTRLETGGVPLEESLALWERGEALAARCQQWLDGARQRLDAVLEGRGGERTDEAGAAAPRGRG